MKIIFCGNGERGITCFDALLSEGFDILFAVGNPPTNEKNWYRSFTEFATEKGINTYSPRDVHDPEFLSLCREANPDLIVLAGFSQIVKSSFISIPKYGCINLHGGKLPEYRGSSPINWSIINGETKSEISIIKVVEGVDKGPILAKEEFDINCEDTAKDIVDKTLKLFPGLLVDTVRKIEKNQILSIEQNELKGAYFPRRTPSDGMILWDFMTAEEIYNMVRALTEPFPGAFTYLSKRKLYIWKASMINQVIKGIPGKVIKRWKSGIIVMAKDRALKIETIQFEGEEKANAYDIITETGINFYNIRESLTPLADK